MEVLHPLLGRTLVLVAHPDDEAVGCGALLQRMSDAIIVYATDGAPRSDYFWASYGSREEYARVRRDEAERALDAVGVHHFHWLTEDPPIVDQELYRNLRLAYSGLLTLVESEMPDAILTLAYEGGHPDHDSCAFLAKQIGHARQLPVWEMPVYQRSSGEIRYQCFLDDTEGVSLEISREELVRKMNMFGAYASQSEVLQEFLPYKESFRPMRPYDFSKPPHVGELNYESWQWPMKGSDLCQAFTEFQTKAAVSAGKREWGTAA
jgi:N-acetylglucosamine malate deacetylase 2